jgi:polycomb group RING finger protein 4
MELSQATLKGLQVCGSSSVDESTFTILLRLAIQSAVQDAYQSELFDTDKTAKLSPSVFKECLSVLLTFILEAARTDTDSGGISSVLEDCKFAPDRIRRLQTIFAESRLQLRASLGRVRSSLPYLLDVNWRLDYYIKNNNLEKVDKPVYLISLKTEVNDNCLKSILLVLYRWE